MATKHDVISILGRIRHVAGPNFTIEGGPGPLIDMAGERDKRVPNDKLRELVDDAIRDRLAEMFIADADRLRERIAERDTWINGLNADASDFRERAKELQAHIKAQQTHIKALHAHIAAQQKADLARPEIGREASERYRASLRRLLRGCGEGWDVERLRDAIEAILGDPDPRETDDGEED